MLTNGTTGDIVRKEFGEDHFWPHDDSDEAWKTEQIPLQEVSVKLRHEITYLTRPVERALLLGHESL